MWTVNEKKIKLHEKDFLYHVHLGNAMLWHDLKHAMTFYMLLTIKRLCEY